MRTFLLLLAVLGSFVAAPRATAQDTTNLAPRIAWAPGIAPARTFAACAGVATGTTVSFDGLVIEDADAAATTLLARFELEPDALGTASTIDVAGLDTLPGVTVIVVRPQRVRFTATLDSLNAALAALRYHAPPAAQHDVLEIIVEDAGVPLLGTHALVRLDVGAAASAPVACGATLDLEPASDTGSASDDDITAAVALSFRASPVPAGATVTLLRHLDPVATGVADASGSIVLTEPAAPRDVTETYAVDVGGDASPALSVAIVDTTFADGFEDLAPPAQ